MRLQMPRTERSVALLFSTVSDLNVRLLVGCYYNSACCMSPYLMASHSRIDIAFQKIPRYYEAARVHVDCTLNTFFVDCNSRSL